MVSTLPKRIVLFVVVMAVVQIFLEDVLLFLGTTRQGVLMLPVTPVVLLVLPLAFSLVLFGVLFVAAMRYPGGR